MKSEIKTCTIFTGGVIEDYSFVDIRAVKDSLVICADSGYNHANQLKIIPQVAIGDFDSYNKKDIQANKVISYPKEKDDTDFMLCIKYALEQNIKKINVYGAFGGRLDHTFANVQALDYIKSKGADGFLIGYNDVVQMLYPGSYTIDKLDGYALSVFSYSEKCEGVTLNGVKYTLDNGEINNSFPVGISNEFIDDFAQISFSKGKMLIILSKK